MKTESIRLSQFQNEIVKEFISKACQKEECDRLGIEELSSFFIPK
jgi:hypothetical protein